MSAESVDGSDMLPDSGCITDAAQKMAHAKLVPGAKHVTRTDSGHEIHREQPQLVLDAIREVVETVRRGCARVVGC